MVYKTTDLNIATSLTTAGFGVKEITFDNYDRVCFHFEESNELKKAINDFRLDKLELPAQSLLIKYRQLKAIVKEIRKEESFRK